MRAYSKIIQYGLFYTELIFHLFIFHIIFY